MVFKFINIGLNDDTYVYGNMVTNILAGKPTEPYYYLGKPEEDDPDDTITEYYPSKNLFVVYHYSKIIRIVETCISWSDDYDKNDFKDDMVIKREITEHGGTRCYITYTNNVITDISITGRKDKFKDFAHIGDSSYNVRILLEEYDIPYNVHEGMMIYQS